MKLKVAEARLGLWRGPAPPLVPVQAPTLRRQKPADISCGGSTSLTFLAVKALRMWTRTRPLGSVDVDVTHRDLYDVVRWAQPRPLTSCGRWRADETPSCRLGFTHFYTSGCADGGRFPPGKNKPGSRIEV